MIWRAKMLLKINQKSNEILDAFLMDFGAQLANKNSKKFCPGDSPLGAWILNLPRIRLNTFSHALLPQRGAADRRRLTATHRRPFFWVKLAETIIFPDIWRY